MDCNLYVTGVSEAGSPTRFVALNTSLGYKLFCFSVMKPLYEFE